MTAGLLVSTMWCSPVPAAAASTASVPKISVPGITVLFGAACPTASACVAVGSGGNGDDLGKSAVIDASTGAARPGIGSLADAPLEAVACPSGSATCVAVGSDAVATVNASTGAVNLASVLKTRPTAAFFMSSIACASSSTCYAAGALRPRGSATSKAVLVELSGAGKLTKEIPDSGTGIGAIACPTATRCLVSDDHAGVSIQVVTRGKFGAVTRLPAGTYVEALSCFRAVVCYALAGTDVKSKSSPPLTDELVPLNTATGARGVPVRIGHGFTGYALACPSATRCVIVGAIGYGSNARPTVVVVNDGQPAAPAYYEGQSLSGIGCASATVCYAVGLGSAGAVVDKVSP